MGHDWQDDLEAWLEPFVAVLWHKTRGRMCPSYVAGLIGPEDRKSFQLMAARSGDASYDCLHHCVSSGVWDAIPLEAALLIEADAQIGGDDA
jgi:SRSO17 transposase